MHQIVHEGLEDVIEYLIRCDLEDLELEINKEENIGKCFIVSIFIVIKKFWDGEYFGLGVIYAFFTATNCLH